MALRREMIKRRKIKIERFVETKEEFGRKITIERWRLSLT